MLLKNFLAGLVCLFLVQPLSAQTTLNFFPSSHIKFITPAGDTLLSGTMGGLNNPMLSKIELNGDGVSDLHVYDRQSQQSYTFLATGFGSRRYMHAPQYEAAFPPMHDWVWLVDYDKDGKEDIFTHGAPPLFEKGNLTVYRNVSTGSKLEFELVKDGITARTRFTSNGHLVGVSHVETPYFGDLDKDGDVDVLTFELGGTAVRYYKNTSQENFSHSDSLTYDFCDHCWGQFVEADGLDSLKLKVFCPQYLTVKKTGAHAGSSLLAFDFDADNDMDLLVGDVADPRLLMLENGYHRTGQADDTIDVMHKKQFYLPTGNVKLPNMPQGHFIDADNDGLRDFVATPMEVNNSKGLDFILFYKNTAASSSDAPKITYETTSNFLIEDIVDLGIRSAPAFLDEDGDGDLDLIVATSGDPTEAMATDYLVLYRNVGTSQRPVYRQSQLDYLQLKANGHYHLIPTVADLDRDGKLDLLLGNELGRVLYYRNTSTGSAASFTLVTDKLQYNDNGSMTVIDAGNKSAIAAGDVDADGWPDLIIGGEGGKLHYYRNTQKSGTTPEFEQISTTLGGLSTGKAVAPALADLNKDGKLDLIVGDSLSGLSFYSDIKSQSGGTFTRQALNFYDFYSESFTQVLRGQSLVPAIASLTEDTMPDILMGSLMGGLRFYSSQNYGVDTIPISIGKKQPMQPNTGFSLYPNPVQDRLMVMQQNPQQAYLRMTNMLGQQMLETRLTASASQQVSLPAAMPTGVYVVQVFDLSEQLLLSRKVVVR